MNALAPPYASIAPQTSARDLLQVLFKHRWSMAIIFAATIIGTFFWLFFVRDDAYETSAKVLVKVSEESAPPPSIVGMPPMAHEYHSAQVNTEAEILHSSELVAQVVDYLGMDKPEPPKPAPAQLLPRIRFEVKAVIKNIKDFTNELMIRAGLSQRLSKREFAILMLQKGLLVGQIPESNIVEVKLISPFREQGPIILNTLLSFYQRFRLKLYQDQEAVPFFKDEVGGAGGELQGAEARLQNFENVNNISEIDKQTESLLNQISGARKAAADSRMEYEEASSKLARLNEQAGKPEPDFAVLGAFPRDSFPHTILLQLADLQKEREKLRMTELDNGVRIQNNRSQFETLMKMLDSNLRSVAAEKEAAYRKNMDELASLETRVRALHEKQSQWHDLKRRSQVLEESYIFYRKKLEESNARAALTNRNLNSVAIAEHAMNPLGPVGPRKPLILGISAVCGILFAFLWVSFAQLFDHRIYSHRDLKARIAAPVLAVVPAVKPRLLSAALVERPGSSTALVQLGKGHSSGL